MICWWYKFICQIKQRPSSNSISVREKENGATGLIQYVGQMIKMRRNKNDANVDDDDDDDNGTMKYVFAATWLQQQKQTKLQTNFAPKSLFNQIIYFYFMRGLWFLDSAFMQNLFNSVILALCFGCCNFQRCLFLRLFFFSFVKIVQYFDSIFVHSFVIHSIDKSWCFKNKFYLDKRRDICRLNK